MKERSFFGKIFSSVQSLSHCKQACRKLRCEALEDRQLLSATPTRQFDLVDPFVYNTESKVPDSVLCMTSARLSSQDRDDLIVVDETTNSIQVLKYNADDGVFDKTYGEATKLTEKLVPNTMSFAFTDVNDDGRQDFVIAKIQTNGTKFDLFVYTGNENGSFTRQSPYSGYSVPFLTNNTNYLLGDVRIQSYNDNDIVVQCDVTSKDSQSMADVYNLTYYYTGVTQGTTVRFSTTGTEVSSMMADANKTDPSGQQAYVLLGTVEASVLGAGTGDWIVYCDSHTDQSNPTLGFTRLKGSSWEVYTYGLGYSSTVEFARSVGDNHLVLSAQTADTAANAMMVLDLTYADPSTKVISADDPSYVLTGNFELRYAAIAVGAYSASDSHDVVAAYDVDSRFFEETDDAERYTMLSFDISSPAYNSAGLTNISGVDLNNDGLDDLVMMGDHYLWYLLADSSETRGFVDKPQYVDLGQTETGSFTKALFRDFTGDGKVDFAVLGSATGTNMWLYSQTTDLNNDISFMRVGTIVSPYGLFDSVVDFTFGEFSQAYGEDYADLALLVKQSTGSGEYVQYVCVYEWTGSSATYIGRYNMPFTGATAIYSANLFVNDYDEIILARVDSEETRAEIYTIDDAATQDSKVKLSSSIKVADGSAGDTIYVDCDDINGDKRVDIAWLYKPALGIGYSMGYSLQSTGGTFDTVPTVSHQITGTNAQYTGLVLGYVDDDVYLDLGTTVSSSEGIGVYAVWGQAGDDLSKFNWSEAYVSSKTLEIESGYGMPAIAFGHMTNYSSDGNFAKSSNDVAIAYGNTIAIWSNQAKSSGCTGTAYVLCQEATPNTAATLDDAYEKARLWIDEFSYFSLDVWASSNGAGDVNSFSFDLDFDSDIFVVNDVVAGNADFDIDYTTNEGEDGFNTITVTGIIKEDVAATYGNESAFLLARVYFKPAADGKGVPLNSEGVFSTAYEILGTNAFSILPENIILNDMPIAEIGKTYDNSDSLWDKTLDSIEDLYLFPVVFDIDDDGVIGSKDYGSVIDCYGLDVTGDHDQFKDAYKVNKLLSVTIDDNIINSSDYGLFIYTYGIGNGLIISEFKNGVYSTYDCAGLLPMDLYYRDNPPSPIASGVVVDEVLFDATDGIIEDMMQPEDVLQTTGSANPYDLVLVELSDNGLSVTPNDENESADDLAMVTESEGTPIVPRAIEKVVDKREINILVTEGKSDSVKRGLNLSLDTELEPELV